MDGDHRGNGATDGGPVARGGAPSGPAAVVVPAEPARGRRPSTTREEVARVALDLFDRRGYDGTTVDDIAAAVGIGRRTLFRYFDSKADIVWGEFDTELDRLRERLVGAPADRSMMDVLRSAIVATNHFGAGELGELRIRMALIGSVPALVAHSAVRYEAWCAVVAEFAAGRLGGEPGDLAPQAVARAALGAAMAAFTCWARDESVDLVTELDRALVLLAGGFGGAVG
jgi:mycofactocin system transcriptional regulator